jgi:hypothetical protein
VEAQEVVRIKTRPAENAVKATMRGMSVVGAEPAWKPGIAFGEVEVSVSVNPFSENGLDTTFCFANGAAEYRDA